MPYHNLKCKDFIGKSLGVREKMYLLGGTDKLAEIFITQGTMFYDYKIVVKNTVNMWCLFEDEEGDQYSCICLWKGQHTTNYNSTAPAITEVYVKGDAIDKYQDLRLSLYDI